MDYLEGPLFQKNPFFPSQTPWTHRVSTGQGDPREGRQGANEEPNLLAIKRTSDMTTNSNDRVCDFFQTSESKSFCLPRQNVIGQFSLKFRPSRTPQISPFPNPSKTVKGGSELLRTQLLPEKRRQQGVEGR